jgi:hypothetical protein
LNPLPLPNEQSPLLPKDIGKGPVTSTRHIRRLVQLCFDKTIERLRKDGSGSDADALEAATVHWLRHTGISDDINKRNRPVAHVRDDAGHGSSATTDRYNATLYATASAVFFFFNQRSIVLSILSTVSTTANPEFSSKIILGDPV